MSLLPSGGPLWLWLGLAGVFGFTAVFARSAERREAAYNVLLAFLPWNRRHSPDLRPELPATDSTDGEADTQDDDASAL